MPVRSALRLRSKLVLLAVSAVGVTACASFLLTTSHYRQLSEREYDLARERLGRVTEHYAERVADVFRGIEEDAEMLNGLPAFATLIRTARSEGDRASGDDPTLPIRNLIETIFESLLTVRPNYTQVRFIGIEDNWKEIVRVNRDGGAVVDVAPEDLQVKGTEPYLARAGKLKAGESYFSEITLNREHGTVDGPPTVRLVSAAVDETGALFGVIVINAEYEGILRAATPGVLRGDKVTVINSALDYIVYDGTSTTPNFVFRSDPDWQKPAIGEALTMLAGGKKMLREQGRLIYGQDIQFGDAHKPFNLFVLAEASFDAIFGIARQELKRDVATIVILALVVALGAVMLGRHLTRSLTRLSMVIAAHRDTKQEIRFAIPEGDEIGRLAQVFLDLTNDLVRERNRSAAIVDGAADAIITVSDTGQIEEVNSACEDLFGQKGEDLHGCDIETLLPLPAAKLARFGDAPADPEVQATHTAGAIELTARRADGSALPLELSIRAATYAGHQHFILIARDSTLRKEADRRLAQLIAALERSNAELDNFAYIASHDLKAPLRVIDNASRWLEEDLGPYLSDDTRESMEMLRGRVERMERLLDDLLKHARIGREMLGQERVAGQDIAIEISQLVDLPKGFDLRFTSDFDALDLPRMPIQTVLLNLVSNAVKHHDRDDGSIVVDARDMADQWVFTVCDDGPGIPPQYHQKVFELFQTLKPRDQHESSGMGLAMVRKYVQLAGGEVTIASDGSRGTEFTIRWPKPARHTLIEERAA